MRLCCILLLVLAAACGPAADPTDIQLGETTLIGWVNPRVNDINQALVAQPGTTRAGVSVRAQGGPGATTDANGIAVLSPIPSGSNQQFLLSGGGFSGDLFLNITAKDLREVAVALDGSGSHIMADVRYAFGGQVVEVNPAMTVTEINSALNGSNQIVLFTGGDYTGDYTFNGSNVTLFGEGASGGRVTLNGNITVSGSFNRIRGTRINGTLAVNGSDFGLTSSRVTGTTLVDGSDALLIDNDFCATVTVTGSGSVVLENSGLAPIAATGC